MDASEDTQTTSPPSAPVTRRGSLGYLAVALFLIALIGGAYWLKTRPGPVEAPAAATQEALMKAGLDALYTRNDPGAAATQFRKVLAINPSHYGATYQLATALDRAGKPAEALPYWEKLLPMAEAVKDEATLATVRARLRKAAPTGEAAAQADMMKVGLDALYKQNNPQAAAEEFRKVLDRNPTHYGATFQLATALDRSGKRAEARPMWEKVLKMAETYKDQKTVEAARARLAQKP